MPNPAAVAFKEAFDIRLRTFGESFSYNERQYKGIFRDKEKRILIPDQIEVLEGEEIVRDATKETFTVVGCTNKLIAGEFVHRDILVK